MTELNAYRGSVYQQASSGISITDQACYELSGGCFSEYGFEYLPGYEEDGAYITWINDGRRAWRIGAGGMQADPLVEISARPVPKEPMVSLVQHLFLLLCVDRRHPVHHPQLGSLRELW